MEWEMIGLWATITSLVVGIIWLLWCAIGNK
jgi:hypothetical protein